MSFRHQDLGDYVKNIFVKNMIHMNFSSEYRRNVAILYIINSIVNRRLKF